MNFLCRKKSYLYGHNILPRFLRYLEEFIKSLPKEHDFKFHDIKQDPITVAELEKCASFQEVTKHF
jgi:hypothetical protein